MRELARSICLVLLFSMTSCVTSSNQAWEDLKTAGRYMHRGIDALFGKEYESRLLTSDEEFVGPYDAEFIPLKDSDLFRSSVGSDVPVPQPKGIPGQKGVPALTEFYMPPAEVRQYFQSVHFDTNDHVVKNQNEIEYLFRLASFLKERPNVFLMIEGHCDERASASYNMALGMRRANFVRSFLVKQGVDLNRVYTVSRGKEQPVTFGHSEEEWKLNRRSEFKIYERENEYK